jgi:hypothetical protein
MTDEHQMLHAYEIMNKRRYEEELRKQSFRTADFPMYTLEKKKAVLYLAKKENNPILKNTEEAINELKELGLYMPTKKDIEEVIESAGTLRIVLSDLIDFENCLSFEETDCGGVCLKIDPKDHGCLNQVQRPLAERVYGQGNDFVENMKMLRECNVHRAEIDIVDLSEINNLIKYCTKGRPISAIPNLSSFFQDIYLSCNGLRFSCRVHPTEALVNRALE